MTMRPFSRVQPVLAQRGDQLKKEKRSWREKLGWSSGGEISSRTSTQQKHYIDPAPSTSSIKTSSHNQSLAVLGTTAPSDSQISSIKPDTLNSITVAKGDEDITISTDLWSAAYLEALHGLGDGTRHAILKGEKIEALLISLERTNKDLAGDSLFRRGLRRLQTPLRNFKLALDLASPLTSLQPIASTAVGVVSCVTAIAVAVCGAEGSLNTQIVSMLEHVAIIDDCDTLGQKLDFENGIHKALVPVYRDLLDFYIAALDILTSKAFVLALACNQLNQRLPTIVSDFVKHAALLRDRIGNATLELVTDIKQLLQDNKIQKLLGADKDKQRSEFHSELRRLRASDACTWIIMDDKFTEWYNSPTSRQLIVTGHMGCGKTVITAHVIEELIRLGQHKLPRPTICYHYCGNDERGTALYIYSSILLQLLEQQEGLKVEFNSWHDRTKKSECLDPVQSSTDLGNFLSKCVERLDRELFIIIDALDECDNDSRDEIVALLDKLSCKTQRLKIFFSSRPYEAIEDSLHRTAKIHWCPTLERDSIIVEHVVKRSLRDIPLAVRSLVIQRLSESADGSAIWVKLTVQLIQKRKIKALEPMKHFLASIPPPVALSQLYGRLFAQAVGDDSENEQITTSALQILAAARRPMSILELGWAVSLCDPGVDTLKQAEALVDEKRVLNLLLPFLSEVDFKDDKKRQVRLVHQSLKELILQDSPSTWIHTENTAIMSPVRRQVTHQRQSELDATLLHICIKYLLFDEFNGIDLLSDEQETIQSFEEMPLFASFDVPEASVPVLFPHKQGMEEQGGEANKTYYDPAKRGFGEFYVYASCFWTDHYGVCSQGLLPATADIMKLSKTGSKRLQNWLGQNCRPDCTITPKFTNDSLVQDPLTIISLYGPETALRALLEDPEIDLTNEDFREHSVKQSIKQIIQWGDMSRLSILFRDARVGPRIRNIGIFHQIMIHWTYSDKTAKSWEGVFDLVFDICDDILVREGWGNELLCLAVSCGCLPIVQRLFEEAGRKPALRNVMLQDVRRDIRPPDYHQSVGEAVWYNHVEVLRYLLEQEGIDVHIQHYDSDGYNIIHKAARWCNPEVISLLVTRFPAGVNQRNKHGDTPLHLVVFEAQGTSGRLESARILLTQGRADVRGMSTKETSEFKEPLRMATRYGDAAMCRVLVKDGGADPLSPLKYEQGCYRLLDTLFFEELGPSVLETLCSLAHVNG